MRRRVGTAVSVAALLTTLVVAPAALAQSADTSAEEVVLRVGTTADLVTANPFGVNSGSDWSVVTAQYDLLLKFDNDDLTPSPGIATGCEPNADSTEWTCKIRPGLTWSDGTPLTSRDVAFTFQFVIDHKVPQYRSYFPSNPTFETPDDSTLIWKADEPTFAPDIPPWVYIVPEHIWSEYVGKDLKTIKGFDNIPSIVSGPFMLTDWQRGKGWTMERNPEFWGESPTVDRIEFRLYTNQESMVQALKNGEIDLADGLNPSLFTSLEGDPDITTQQVVSDWWLNLAFNFGGQGPDADPLPALADIEVRKAIQMAIDKQEIVDKVYMGTANPGETVVREASAYWHLDVPDEQTVPYDPQAAAQMLETAGYTDTDEDGLREDPKTGEPLVIRMPASEDTTGAVDAGRLIAGYLEEVGIAVELQPASDAKMNDYWGSGDFDAYIWYWSGDPDPNYQLSIFASDQCGGWSDGCWQDPAYDKLYEEQRSIMDREARREVVYEAQQHIYDQVPIIALAYPSWLQAYRNDRFTGWVPAPGAAGYLIPGYNYNSLIAVQPVEGAAAASSSPGLPAWIWVGAVAVGVVVIGFFALRGRRRMDDEA